jgi:hypothetical protein
MKDSWSRLFGIPWLFAVRLPCPKTLDLHRAQVRPQAV